MSTIKNLYLEKLRQICADGLIEDGALNDITSDLTIKNQQKISFKIAAREDLILCGVDAIDFCFAELKKSSKFKNSDLSLKIKAKDGKLLKAKSVIAEGIGDAKLILAGERVILNLLQHLSAVATLTNQFAQVLNNKKIKILDTRKTLPTLRALQKYAVLAGGGANHRFNLSDMILIKDNHIAAANGVENALKLAKKSDKKIEIECDNFAQVASAIAMKPDVIMLDNMAANQIKKCANLIREKSAKTKIEISGGVNLKNIKNFSKLDIDFISIGALTHSAKAVDIGLDIL